MLGPSFLLQITVAEVDVVEIRVRLVSDIRSVKVVTRTAAIGHSLAGIFDVAIGVILLALRFAERGCRRVIRKCVQRRKHSSVGEPWSVARLGRLFRVLRKNVTSSSPYRIAQSLDVVSSSGRRLAMERQRLTGVGDITVRILFLALRPVVRIVAPLGYLPVGTAL